MGYRLPTVGPGYVVAVAMTTLMFALRYQLRDVLGEFSPFLPFILAVVFAAWYGGLWPGLMATVLSASLAMYFFIIPVDSPASLTGVVRGVTVLVFLAIGGSVSLLCEELHAARRKLEVETQRVRENTAFNQIITELTSDFVYKAHIDSSGMLAIDSISDGFTKLLGYSHEEMLARGGWMAFVHADDRGRVARLPTRLRAGDTVEGEARFVARDGRVVWLRFRMRPMLDERGHLAAVFGAASDITGQRETDFSLRASEERFRVMAETVPSMIWTADPDGTITYANDQWFRYCGLTREPNARGWPELALHPDDLERCRDEWNRALRDGTDYEIEVRYRRHDGEYRWFVTRAMPLRDDAGHVLSWIGVTTDIHEQIIHQEQLREADRAKDEFLATLAHELRNPLAPLRNALYILERSTQDGARSEQARRIIERQVQHMVRLVDDLLDVSRITRGRLELQREPIDAAVVLRDAVETSRPLIEGSGLELDIRLPATPLLLHGDRTRLAQVFANLLNNAAKFTGRGGRVEISAAREGSDVVVTVSDTGIGIRTEMLPRIFDMFAQSDRPVDRAQSGLGIGLTIVKRLVEMHGGIVEARSEGPGRGSQFIVRLPALVDETSAQPGAVASADRPRIRGSRRVLVVDDNEDALTSLTVLLRLAAHEVLTARDGPEALEVAASERPDVVLLDIGLPKLDGCEVARRIRKESWGKEILLAAVTGWGQESDRRRTKEAGFDVHLTKPVDPAALEKLLTELRPATAAA
jgi:two-component system, chemotaxis family, CheB/CheR fusion protein